MLCGPQINNRGMPSKTLMLPGQRSAQLRFRTNSKRNKAEPSSFLSLPSLVVAVSVQGHSLSLLSASGSDVADSALVDTQPVPQAIVAQSISGSSTAVFGYSVSALWPKTPFAGLSIIMPRYSRA